MTSTEPKRNWGDEVDEANGGNANADTLPETTKTIGADGVVTIVEWRWDDMETKRKIKTTRRIKTTVKREKVNAAVAERKKWAKFGQSASDGAGPNTGTTQLAEAMTLKLTLGKNWEVEAAEQASQQGTGLKLAGESSSVQCRTCKGNHWTSKCPYKDTLGVPADIAGSGSGSAGNSLDDLSGKAGGAGGAGSAAGSTGRYLPPSLRRRLEGGAEGGGSRFDDAARAREDACTIRVINLSEDTTDMNLRMLTQRFGRVSRAYLAKDRETFACKGYAFVTYEDRADAQKAMDTLDGHKYDNLILRVEWAKARD